MVYSHWAEPGQGHRPRKMGCIIVWKLSHYNLTWYRTGTLLSTIVLFLAQVPLPVRVPLCVNKPLDPTYHSIAACAVAFHRLERIRGSPAV